MKETKLHRAWLVFLGGLLAQSALMGIMVNTCGVLMAAIRTEMGFSAGSLSVYYTIRSLSSAFTLALTAKMYFDAGKKGGLVLGLQGLSGAASFFLMAFYSKVWHWYISGVLMGIAMGSIMTIIPVTINTWFNKYRGTIVGLTSAASGIGGALFSPLVSTWVGAFGWRTAAQIIALVGIVMTTVASFLIVPSPEQVGCKPFGEKENIKTTEKEEDREYASMSVFWLATAMVMVSGTLCSFANQMPTFAQSVGYTLQTASIFTSITMIGNISGKLLIGALSDKIGIYKALIVNVVSVAVSLLIFIYFPQQQMIMMAGHFLFGLSYSIGTVGPSQMFLDLFGKKVYRDHLKKTQTINSFFMAGFSLLIPVIFDKTGSFSPVFIMGTVMSIITVFMVLKLLHISNNLKIKKQ